MFKDERPNWCLDSTLTFIWIYLYYHCYYYFKDFLVSEDLKAAITINHPKMSTQEITLQDNRVLKPI